MFTFVDGRPVVLPFSRVEQLFYQAFIDRFPEAAVSKTQFLGSYEYQTLYPAMQMMVENGELTMDALNEVLTTVDEINEAIRRPAVLHSKVADRFAEEGYEANIRVADATTKGIVAICVDQERGEEPRTMVIGVDPANELLAGYSRDVFGSLDHDDIAEGTYIQYFTTSSTGGDITYLRFNSEYDSASGLNITFTGAFTGGFVFVSEGGDPNPSALWACTDPALSAAFLANIGNTVKFEIAEIPAMVALNDDDQFIAELIRDEMLPAGQHIEGDVVYPTALSNGQPLTIRWTIPLETTHDYRVTFTRARGSKYPIDTNEEIIDKFMTNFDTVMGIGSDITPQVYMTVRDCPWASAVLVEWFGGDGQWHRDDYTAAYNARYLANLDPANVFIN